MSLLKSFNEIYVIDLHGNSNVEEYTPVDVDNENVFDIKQGVAITIALRTDKIVNDRVAKVRHCDVYGTREEKYAFLENHNLKDIVFEDVTLRKPLFYFKNKSYKFIEEYSKWPSLSEIYKRYSTGYYTSSDEIVIADNNDALRDSIDGSSLNLEFDENYIKTTIYRPFDYRKVYYDENVLARARSKFVKALPEDNVIIIAGKSTKNHTVDHFFISNVFSELKCGESSKGSYMFPLLVSAENGLSMLGDDNVNIRENVIKKYRVVCGKKMKPADVQMYIYAIMYSEIFRATFAESIKDDFVRIPYPESATTFARLAASGRELFELHTLRHASLDTPITSYPEVGSNQVTRPIGKADWEPDEETGVGRVWVNESQYFADIPIGAWEFSVGGYLPAQKWLKDRKGRELGYEEIVLYQRIIVALNETIRVMDEIDEEMEPILKKLEVAAAL